MTNDRYAAVKPKLLLLTELSNAQDGEDEYLAQQLSGAFDLTLVSNQSLLQSRQQQQADGILIRNNWPAFSMEEAFWTGLHHLYKALRAENIPCYNDLSAKGDMQGKVYLHSLMREGFKVIPTVLEKSQIELLPVSAKYVVKPYYGGDSWGLKILEKNEVLEKNLEGFVVQPFLEIVQEVHYVFVDKKFVYAFVSTSRREDPMPDDIQVYNPSDEELAFATQFALWNNLEHGLQRIDVVTTSDQQLFLNELEDHCPYLWLAKMPERVRGELIDRLISSLTAWCSSR